MVISYAVNGVLLVTILISSICAHRITRIDIYITTSSVYKLNVVYNWLPRRVSTAAKQSSSVGFFTYYF